ncbi:MAG: TonB-dependent receptor plug domain-containing protein [Thermodesulfobacteriota bacterium]
MRNMTVAGVILGLLALSQPLWAQTETTTQNLADVVVTATRTEAGLDQVGGTSLSVITAEEIEARQFHSLAQALRTVPGVQFSSTGGMGASSRVFIRGADTKNTLLLVDGIEANDPADPNRGADLANISVENIERIEVIRGPMSVLYGSNATAGVINVITRSGTGDVGGYVGGEAGAYNTTKGYAGVNGSGAIGGFSLAVSHLETDGYSLANADNNNIPHAGNTSEDDGWRNTSASGKFNLDITENTSLNVVTRYTEAVMDEDEWGPGYAGDRFATDPVTWANVAAPNGVKKRRQDSERFFGKVELRNQLFDDRFESVLDYKYARQKRDSYDNDGLHAYDYTGITEEWSWQGKLNMTSHHGISVGADYLNEESDSTFDHREDARTLSYWAQHQFMRAGFDVVTGVRYDDHEEFGGKTTWRIAPAYTFASTGTILRGVYATGFRAPSLYELYSQYGNVTLDPEESTSWEVGVEQPLFDGQLEVGATHFWMEFEDRIDWDSTRVIPGQAWPGGYAQMEGESNTSGVEVFLRWSPVSSLDMRLDYTYTDTEDIDGSRMVRRPLHQVHTGLNYTPWRSAGINVDAYWVGEREAVATATDLNGAGVDVLDEYFLVNIAANYDLTDALRIYARVDNLLDEHYEEAWSYATAGQSFYAGAKFTF